MKKQLYIIVGLILAVLAGLSVWYLGIDYEGPTADEIKFKSEYESLNGSTSTSGKTYQTLSIIKDNKVEYTDLAGAIDMLESGTGIIYFGFPDCPWCRNLVSVLIDEIGCSCLEKITYVNISGLRDTYELQDGEAVKTQNASSEYYKILELLDSYLNDYTLLNGEESVNVGEKRLYVPLVVGVKKGRVVGVIAEMPELEEGQNAYDNLTETQKSELKSKIKELISSVTKEEKNEDEGEVCEERC